MLILHISSVSKAKLWFSKLKQKYYDVIFFTSLYRSVRFNDENEVPLTVDYGRGDMVGLEEVLLKSERRSQVLAVRDSDSKFLFRSMSSAWNVYFVNPHQVVTFDQPCSN